MSDRMNQAWKRFEAALTAAELGGRTLAPGASAEQLAAFEAATDLRLPDSVRSFWLGHAGEAPRDAGLAGGFCFVSVVEAQKIMADWAGVRSNMGKSIQELDRACSSRPKGMIQRKYSSPAWVPVLRDHEGNYVGVDLNPGLGGTLGQVINFGRDEQDKHVLFPSVVELVDWLAQEYEADRIFYDDEDKIIIHIAGRLIGAIPASD